MLKWAQKRRSLLILSIPIHKLLLSATPRLSPELRRQRIKLKGELPSPINPPKGCAFNPRCWKATDKCRNEQPKLENILTVANSLFPSRLKEKEMTALVDKVRSFS